MQSFTVQYTPPHVRSNSNICNIKDEKPLISLAENPRRMEPMMLKQKVSINNKDTTKLVDFGSTHNFVDIKIAKKLNL